MVTDTNGLIYMHARYYSPELRRFVNADIIPGEISQAVTLNRYAYANDTPVSNVDPFGLKAWDRWLKVGVGVAVIAGLAVVVTVATLNGFRQWYILQHWNALSAEPHPKPFVTTMEFDVSFSGEF